LSHLLRHDRRGAPAGHHARLRQSRGAADEPISARPSAHPAPHGPGQLTSSAMRALDHPSSTGGISSFPPPALAWWLWYLDWRQGSLYPDPNLPVFVSLTDFRFHAPRHAPGAWGTGLKIGR